MSDTAKDTTPGYARAPMMVCVLPEPVCPYANTVPLMPSSAESTTRRTCALYNGAFSASSTCTPSKANTCKHDTSIYSHT
eukprot:4597701-Pyramimonas_sp.AAC.1